MFKDIPPIIKMSYYHDYSNSYTIVWFYQSVSNEVKNLIWDLNFLKFFKNPLNLPKYNMILKRQKTEFL